MKPLKLGLSIAALMLSSAASAQMIYRCGDSSFSDAPCTGAKLFGPATIASPDSGAAAERTRQYWADQKAGLAQREATRSSEFANARGAAIIPVQKSALPDRAPPSTWGGTPQVMPGGFPSR